MVNIGSLLVSGALFFLVDFSGNRLDLSARVTSDFNPIISFSLDGAGGDSNQKVSAIILFLFCINRLTLQYKWLLIPLGGTNLQIQSSLGPFVSYPLASSKGPAELSAAVSSQEFPLNFTMIPANTTDTNAFL